jgi:multidrug efflux pump subunit AcrA (membrane-fusion protein)
MSGSPKYSQAQLERQRQQQLEEERRRQAAEEARLRAEAAEKLRLQRVESRKNIGEIQEIIAGLKADPVVMRWHSHSVSELEQELEQANQASDSDQFDVPSQILTKAKGKEKQIIEEANIAQLKADKRDYITESIVATLQDMGFGILSIEEEHTGHPSTAKIFTATAAGRAISVSVPVEGEVWYNVDGYSKNTVASVADASPVAICDEAEAVLTEMHSALQQEFGIQMGEISWQGKDPNRITRTATDLPTDAQQSRGGSR